MSTARMEPKANHGGDEQADLPFVCKLCEKRFRWSSSLHYHLKTHSGEKLYECKECGKRFSSTSNLNKHVRSHTGEKRYHCQECGNGFTQNHALKKHVLSVHRGIKTLSCDICQKKFSTQGKLKVHKEVHTRKPYFCQMCKKLFESVEKLQAHLIIHTDKNPHKCTICQKGYMDKRGLDEHMQLHQKEKSVLCPECGKSFRKPYQLKIHRRSHAGLKTFVCPICGFAITRHFTIKMHIQQEHVDPLIKQRESFILEREIFAQLGGTAVSQPYKEELYACVVCRREFQMSLELRDHLVNHARDDTKMKDTILSEGTPLNQKKDSKERQYSCRPCAKLFSTLAAYRRHCRLHKRPHCCDMCSKRFADANSLKLHKIEHTLRPHTCQRCSKCFPTAEQLEKHSEMHTDQQPIHRCNVCNKVFTQADLLRSHISTHERENPGMVSTHEKPIPSIFDAREIEIPPIGSSYAMGNLPLVSSHEKDSSMLSPNEKEPSSKSITHVQEQFLYTCHVCSSQFPTDHLLTKHMLSHFRLANVMNCPLCDSTFQSVSTLKAHLRTHIGAVEHKELPTDGQKVQENALVVEDSTYACQICNASHQTPEDMAEHLTVHVRCEYLCGKCGREFYLEAEYMKHAQFHRDVIPHQCIACGENFPTQVAHMEHARKIHGVKMPCVCSICAKDFAGRQALVRHIDVHHPDSAPRSKTAAHKPTQRKPSPKKSKAPAKVANFAPSTRPLGDGISSAAKSQPNVGISAQELMSVNRPALNVIVCRCVYCRLEFSMLTLLDIWQDMPIVCTNCAVIYHPNTISGGETINVSMHRPVIKASQHNSGQRPAPSLQNLTEASLPTSNPSSSSDAASHATQVRSESSSVISHDVRMEII